MAFDAFDASPGSGALRDADLPPAPVRRAPRCRPLDVAIAGTRGVPASYGGFETFAEELGRRLAARGHRVTVYGRVPYVGAARRAHLGIDVVPVPSPRGKHVETPLHTLLTARVAARAGHDVIVLCNAANAFAVPLLRRGGAKVVVNVDGLDRLRRKWGVLGRLWYEVGERLAVRLPDRALADADVIADAYARRHGRALPVIPYGGDRAAPGDADPRDLAAWGLTPGGYVLAVGRLEPENNALLLASAWTRAGMDVPLVIVGDAPYADDYKRQVRLAAGPAVRLLGGVYDRPYLSLQAHAACYVAAGEVGGTHPALLEAMALGGVVVANDVAEHREVLGDAGLYYTDGDGFVAAARRVLAEPALAARLRAAARARVAERYRWDDVTDAYEDLFRELTCS